MRRLRNMVLSFCVLILSIFVDYSYRKLPVMLFLHDYYIGSNLIEIYMNVPHYTMYVEIWLFDTWIIPIINLLIDIDYSLLGCSDFIDLYKIPHFDFRWQRKLSRPIWKFHHITWKVCSSVLFWVIFICRMVRYRF